MSAYSSEPVDREMRCMSRARSSDSLEISLVICVNKIVGHLLHGFNITPFSSPERKSAEVIGKELKAPQCKKLCSGEVMPSRN